MNVKLGEGKYLTNDYDRFSFLKGNREINQSNLRNITRNIRERGYYKDNPILVNERLEIVDGQHRFQACKDLGMQFYYVVQKGLTVEDAKNRNLFSRPWTTKDFIEYYCKQGNENYLRYVKLLENNPDFCDSTIQWTQVSDSSHTFGIKNGNLVVTEKSYAMAEQLLAFVRECMITLGATPDGKHRWNNRLSMAFGVCYLFEDIDNNKLLKKLKTCPMCLKHSLEKTGGAEAVKNYLEVIDQIYNYHIVGTNQIDIVHLYKEYVRHSARKNTLLVK